MAGYVIVCHRAFTLHLSQLPQKSWDALTNRCEEPLPKNGSCSGLRGLKCSFTVELCAPAVMLQPALST